MSFARITFFGFGEVGQVLAEDLAEIADRRAFDVLFAEKTSPPCRAAAKLGVGAAENAPAAVAGAELVISAVTAANTVAAARSAAPGLGRGTFFLDLNSASPGMKTEAAEIVGAAGGRYVEAAVMAPIGPKRIASPMLLGGPHVDAFLEKAVPLGFAGTFFAAEFGKASAAKMCRSVMIKGIEALLTESLLTARHYGVEQIVLSSLSDLLPVGDWEKLARYMISRSLEHGTRRAEEMREAAATVAEARLPPLMSTAIAERQDRTAPLKAALAAESLPALLDLMLKGRTP